MELTSDGSVVLAAINLLTPEEKRDLREAGVNGFSPSTRELNELGVNLALARVEKDREPWTWFEEPLATAIRRVLEGKQNG